jgi:hypothetical protein
MTGVYLRRCWWNCSRAQGLVRIALRVAKGDSCEMSLRCRVRELGARYLIRLGLIGISLIGSNLRVFPFGLPALAQSQQIATVQEEVTGTLDRGNSVQAWVSRGRTGR